VEILKGIADIIDYAKDKIFPVFNGKIFF